MGPKLHFCRTEISSCKPNRLSLVLILDVISVIERTQLDIAMYSGIYPFIIDSRAIVYGLLQIFSFYSLKCFICRREIVY